MKKGASIVAATQNFRGGLRDEEKIEEMILQMRRQCINIVCGQESGLANEFAVKRWDTGEMLISCGKNGSNRKKAAARAKYKKAFIDYVRKKTTWIGRVPFHPLSSFSGLPTS